MIRRIVVYWGMAMVASIAWGEGVVSLDSCRAMALRNNKQMLISKARIEGARYQKKEAKAAYLPALDFIGGYTYNQKNLSILGSDQLLPIKNANGDFLPEAALIPKEALTFDIQNVFFGALTLTQPVYMGGKIIALNNIANYASQLAVVQKEYEAENIVYEVDVAYWQVVSLGAKQRLAESYVALLDTLKYNVDAMIREGVATPSDQLRVEVNRNEAHVDLIKVKNGLSLSRMALAQLCGLPIDSDLRLEDEDNRSIVVPLFAENENIESVYARRKDIQQLELGVEVTHQQSRVELSTMLPKVSIIGTYEFTNPNMYSGFSKDFDGGFSVGVMVSVPLWHWGGNYNKYKASQTNETVMRLNLADAKEKVALQMQQASYKAQEAVKTYKMTLENLASANENLRQAQVGFKEGVMTIDNVMEAQTAWLKANSERVDAQIEVQLCNTYLQKVLGLLKPNN